MTNIWILRLLSEGPSEAEWGYWEEGAGFTKGKEKGELAKAAKAIGEEDVLVLVPGIDVSVLTEVVPARQRRQVIKVLPYAMEEQVARDVESLHFALGEKGHDGSYLVAVVNHEKMEEWMDCLDAAGIHPTHMLPDILAIPYEKGTWSIAQDGEICLVRTDDTAAFAMDVNQLSKYLSLELAKLDGNKRPSKICLWHIGGDVKANVEKHFDAGSIEDKSHEQPSLIELFASSVGEVPFVNLVQQRYEKKESVAQIIKYWIPAVVIISVWFFSLLGSQYYQKSQLSAENDKIYNDIRALYKETFPQDKRIVNPTSQMKSHLVKLKTKGAGNQFLSLLMLAGEQLSLNPDVKLLSMRFSENNGTLELELETQNFQRFEGVMQSLSSVLDVSVRTSNIAQNNLVQGILLIKQKQ